MNKIISKVYSKARDTRKGKVEIWPDNPFVPESTVDSERAKKNKDNLIVVTYRYRCSARNSKNNNYVI